MTLDEDEKKGVVKLIEKLLIALDGSDSANEALEFALDIAEKFSAEILLLTVVHQPLWPYISVPGTMPVAVANLKEDLRASHKRVLTEAVEEIKKKKPNIQVSAKLIEGHAADKIVEMAKEEKVDLIVLGSRGLSGVKRFLLGSVSHNVAHHCECPVLIVK